MCGIVGFVSPRSTASGFEAGRLVARMAASLAHRGPDSQGVWASDDARVALGHRRLAVVDLSPTGAQPMHSRDGRFTIVYNGEIYNYRELRGELEGHGRSFVGTSDTEVLLAAFEHWGVLESLRRVSGMLAFAVWDGTAETLWLARDRIGEKPLTWGQVGNTVLFASEARALRLHPAFESSLDPVAVDAFLRYLCVPAPLSIYRGMRKLLPGCALEIDVRGERLSIREHRYHDTFSMVEAALCEGRSLGVREACSRLEASLQVAVRRQMIADVPLGIFLSGGTDSSTIAMLAQRESAKPVHTFSMGSTDPRYDEAPAAKAIALCLGTAHEEAYVGEQDALEVVPTLGSLYDEPFADSSQVPTVLVSRLARKQVTVVLGGDGGDELLGGYPKYRILPELWRKVSRVPWPARHFLGMAARRLARLGPSYSAVARQGRRYEGLLLSRSFAEFAEQMAMSWRTPPLFASAAEAGSVWWHSPRGAAYSDGEAVMAADLCGYFPDDLLTKVDRASMSVGLEVRLPFLDPEVIKAAWQLPMELRVGSGPTKQVLRQILASKLPASIVNGPKRGFSVPLGRWLTGPLRDWARDTLAVAGRQFDGILDLKAVERQRLQQDLNPAESNHRLWAVLMLSAWRSASEAS
jgi:asparagine synthase (glutamine-hydrolysing)